MTSHNLALDIRTHCGHTHLLSQLHFTKVKMVTFLGQTSVTSQWATSCCVLTSECERSNTKPVQYICPTVYSKHKNKCLHDVHKLHCSLLLYVRTMASQHLHILVSQLTLNKVSNDHLKDFSTQLSWSCCVFYTVLASIC